MNAPGFRVASSAKRSALRSCARDMALATGAITSDTGDHQAFGFAPGSPVDQFSIAPGTTQSVNIEFRPTETRDYTAKVRMSAGSDCGEADVTDGGCLGR